MVDRANAEITPRELKQKLDAGLKIAILDIREVHELEFCKLENTAHIPMGELVQRLAELAPYKGDEIVVYCRSGGRSMRCVQFMRQNGYNALNLSGGILAWSDEIDPTVPQY